MPAITRSRAEIVAVMDADVVCHGLDQAVEAVRAGAAWAMPHRGVYRLTADATALVLAGAMPEGLPTEQPPYLGVEGGGCVVARRRTLLEVPLDPRFIGWGQEDESWGVALRELLGPPHRVKRPLFHLWHPPQRRLTRSRGSMESWALRTRYFRARHDKAAMRRLTQEAHAALHPAEQAVHDPPPAPVR